MDEMLEKPKCTSAEDDSPSAGDSGERVSIEERSLWGYFVKCLKNYATFSGRARRREFWGFYLFYNIGAILMVCIGLWRDMEMIVYNLPLIFIMPYWIFISPITVDTGTGNVVPLLFPLFYWIVFWLPRTAIFIRRQHDIGKSAWRFFYVLVPLLVTVPFLPIVLLLMLDAAPTFLFPGPMAIVLLAVLLITAILAIVWASQNSQPGPNKYGENPKGQ